MGEYSAFIGIVILFFSIEYYLNRLHNIYVYMYVCIYRKYQYICLLCYY